MSAKSPTKTSSNQTDCNTTGETELHVAAISNNLTHLQSLLSLGIIDVNARDAHNRTPLHYAALFNRENSNFGVIQELLRRGASVAARSDFGNTPLHYLARKSDAKTVRLLLEYKADVNVGDNYAESPLFQAVRSGNHEVVELLVNRGCDLNNVSGYDGTTPLHAASIRKSLETIKCFLVNGAKTSAMDHEGRTPLMYMIHHRQYSEKKLEVLLKCTDVNLVDIVSCQDCLKSSSCKIILRHLAKLLALKQQVDSNILSAVSNMDDLSEYFEKCKGELLLAKNTKLKGSWITFFNLLVDGRKKLKNYCGNEYLMSGFRSSDCKLKFPIYGDSILKNVEKGIQRRKLFDESTIVFSDSMPVFNPDHLIVRDVFDCLSTKDLLKFCE